MSRQRVPEAQAQVRRPTAAVDPLILDAVADVDRSLLIWSLELSPRERLRVCSRATAALGRLRRAASGVR